MDSIFTPVRDPIDENEGCSPGQWPGRHRWATTDDPDVFTCRYCGETEVDTSSGHIAPARTWASVSAGYTFAENLNSDGSLKTPEN